MLSREFRATAAAYIANSNAARRRSSPLFSAAGVTRGEEIERERQETAYKSTRGEKKREAEGKTQLRDVGIPHRQTGHPEPEHTVQEDRDSRSEPATGRLLLHARGYALLHDAGRSVYPPFAHPSLSPVPMLLLTSRVLPKHPRPRAGSSRRNLLQRERARLRILTGVHSARGSNRRASWREFFPLPLSSLGRVDAGDLRKLRDKGPDCRGKSPWFSGSTVLEVRLRPRQTKCARATRSQGR